ncbi:MFS transporter [Cupriavidus basilensis]|uniref:Major facilitator superfamily (MFS) profile domain-containing protein n=1 Tax=Cupriavidus basilensis TaxID=68895 RepID=A0A0C4Y3D4_9BURK|nr:MFS transporter [Cupriavidus basilensis]AJG19682.1 hypothetical protein RR42_m2290 [Cupriavidus basilensis]
MTPSYQPVMAWRTALLLVVYMVINFADKIAVGLLAVPMMTELNLSPAQFGLIGSSFFWLFAIGGITGGFMANRLPTTGILLVMALAWSALQVPMAMSSSLAVLVAARVLLGAAEGPAWPVAVHACYKWFPNEKRELPVACLAQGGAIGLLLAGMAMPLVSAHWGWRANFYALAVIGFAWTLLWVAFGKEGRGAEAENSEQRETMHVPYRTLLAEPTVAACIAMKFVSYWGLALTLTWLPAYLQKGLGYGAVESGRLYAGLIATSLPISVAGSWLVRQLLARGVSSRTARGRVAATVVAIGGVACMLVWLGGLPPLWRAALIGLTLGLTQIMYAVGPAILAEVVPVSQRGGILAIDNSIASFAGVLAPLVTGFLVQGMTGSQGYEAGFAICGLLMVAGALAGAVAIDPARAALSVRRRATVGCAYAGQAPASSH